MARNNRADGRRSVWNDGLRGSTCGTCGGSGSAVDEKGRHVGVCPTCRGFGKVE
jgi:DnaJ-class molecular chaperone